MGRGNQMVRLSDPTIAQQTLWRNSWELRPCRYRETLKGILKRLRNLSPLPEKWSAPRRSVICSIAGLNDSFKVLNRLFNQGVEVSRLHQAVSVGDATFPAGAFVAAAGSEDLLTEIAEDCGVTFYALESKLEIEQSEIRRARIGMYQRYWGGNMDEGWTRLVLEQYGFPYQTLRDAEMKAGQFERAR